MTRSRESLAEEVVQLRENCRQQQTEIQELREALAASGKKQARIEQLLELALAELERVKSRG